MTSPVSTHDQLQPNRMLSEWLDNDAVREGKRRTAAPILVNFKSGSSGVLVHGIGKRGVDAHIRPTTDELLSCGDAI